jgi:hypothetical protein
LTVDEDGASGVFPAGGLRVGWNDAVGDGFDRSAFRAGEEKPWARLHGNRRTAGVWCPRETISDDSGAGRQTANQPKRRTRQQMPSTNAHDEDQ